MGNDTTDGVNLKAPLLSSLRENVDASKKMSSSTLADWPEEVSKRVKFLVPPECDPYQESPNTCFMRYDNNKRRFLIVLECDGEDSETILDVIDPNDVTNINIEIETMDGIAVSPRATQTERNDTSTHLEDDRGTRNEPESDVLVDTQGVAVLTIYAYPKRDLSKKSILSSCGMYRKRQPNHVSSLDSERENRVKLGHRHKHHRRFTAAPAEDISDLIIMIRAMRAIIHPPTDLTPDERRLLVVINPVSGRRRGVVVYETILAPMLEEAGISFDSLITSYPRHAEERMRRQSTTGELRDLSEYTGLISIGGDGVMHEIMQGIHSRPDAQDVLKKLKLGMIGAGTSNGLSASLAHASEENFTPMDTAFMIAKGYAAWIDLSRYETTNKSFLSFLTFSWGYIADIDIESEVIRFMGFIRMDIWGALRVLTLRRYRAKLSYLPPTSDRSQGSTLPPLDQPLPTDDQWVSCEDDFVLFWASQVTHAGEQMFHAPSCTIDDGIFNIFIVRGNVSRLRLALIAITMAHGGHVGMQCVEFIQCTAFRLEPITPGSFNDLDGEVVEPGPIQGAVLPRAIQAYCNP